MGLEISIEPMALFSSDYLSGTKLRTLKIDSALAPSQQMESGMDG